MKPWPTILALLISGIGLGIWRWAPRFDSSPEDEAPGTHVERSAQAWWQSHENGRLPTIPAEEQEPPDLAALATAYVEAQDRESQTRALEAVVRHMTRTNAKSFEGKLRSHLDKHPLDQARFYRAWGGLAGKEALMVAGTINQHSSRAAIAGWASTDSSAALDFFNDLQASAHNGDGTTNFFSKEYLRQGVAEGLASADLSAAAAFVDNQWASSQIGDKQVGELIRTVADQAVNSLGPKHALDWASQLSDGLRNEALAGLVRRQAELSVGETLQWLDDYDHPSTHKGAAYYHTYNTWLQQEGGAEAVRGHIDTLPLDALSRHEAISAYSQHQVRSSGPETISLVETISDPNTRHRVLAETFNTWTRQDPQAASEYLAQAAPSSIRDHAITGLATSIARDDPSAAIAWTESIGDQQIKQTAQTLVGLAYLESHHAAAGEWLPQSGLPPETLNRIENPSTADLHRMKFLAR